MNTHDADLGAAPIGELVKHFRSRQGMTQTELAHAIGVSDGMIGNVETGRRNLGIKAVENVANVLMLSPAERDALRGARDRYMQTNDGRPSNGGTPTPAEMFELMRSTSEGLRDLAIEVAHLRDALERRLPPEDH